MMEIAYRFAGFTSEAAGPDADGITRLSLDPEPRPVAAHLSLTAPDLAAPADLVAS
jgi:hypothetical protein